MNVTDSPENPAETPATGPETPAEVPGSAPEVAETGPKAPANAPESDVNGPTGDDSGNPDQHQDLAAQLATMTAERDQLAVQVARMEAATKHQVPADLLTATTPEDLDAQAEKLAAYVNSARRAPDFGGGRRGDGLPAAPDPDPLRQALGR